jgi:outer membrane receptor protein involved in Fe transport
VASENHRRSQRSRARARRATAFLAVLALVVPYASAAELGGIRGAVRDRDFGTPLVGVRVVVVGLPLGAVTGADGTFLLDRVPVGRYLLTLSRDGYERATVADVVVLAGQLAEVGAEMSAEIVDLEEFTVTGFDLFGDTEAGLLDIRAEAVTVQDSVSTETLAKAGVSDVGQAVKLVVGASVTEGKYATVRGLSDRYTGTTVNGLRIPSTDPRRRAVQVDLFPTGTIDALTVTKTFTPDLPGDFTGGGVDIKTKAVPDGPLFQIATSVEYDSSATGNADFLTYVGGGVDKWGFQADERAIPPDAKYGITGATTSNYRASNEQIAANQEVDRVTRLFDPVMGTTTDERSVNSGFSLVGGNRFGLGGGTLGFIGALSYSHTYDFYEDGQNNQVSVGTDNAGLSATPREDNKGTDELLMGLMAGVVWTAENERQEYGLTVLGNEAVEDVGRMQLTQIGGGVQQNQAVHYTERVIGAIQVHGAHTIGEAGPFDAGPVELDWRASTNRTAQDEPDVRFFRNDVLFGTGQASQPSSAPFAGNTRRIFRTIDEESDQVGLDAALPFGWRERTGKLRTGLYVERGGREAEQKSFFYTFASQVGVGAPLSENQAKRKYTLTSPDDLWSDVFLEPDRIGLAGNRCNPGQAAATCTPANQLLWYLVDFNDDVSYDADQDFDAAYAMVELPVHAAVDLIAGVRWETTFLHSEPENVIDGTVDIITRIDGGDRNVMQVDQDDPLAIADLDEESWLPALSAVYRPRTGMNLRFAWSRTIARPQIRELSPAATEEFLAGDQFVGNPALELSDITNWDARWEWFRKPGEVLAASLFYKTLDRPIELISFSVAGNTYVQPVNYETGTVRGAELEARADVGQWAAWAQGLTAGVNATWIDSEVDVPQEEQDSLSGFGLDEPTRRLQGQPAYLLNVFFTYDNDRTGTSAGLFFNRTGETLVSGAATGIDGGQPNVFERGYGVLDFTAAQKIKKNLIVTLRARNLLQPERGTLYRNPQDAEVVKFERDTALRIGLSVGLKW